ncbi:hypothetical protein B0T20DRAFT_478127 [Sordaria brevicollis]|uniref:Uncharacterized protein n=1 Tax=Sordaria brevicollis TaxID=83679 RepID=A0AAE0UDN2_SORBR|nr:hypothetical protein B0T20DRAFT_478127 [Sordaria brevicollis]
MAPWDVLGDILGQDVAKDASQWAQDFLPQAGAAVSNLAGDVKKHAEQFSKNAGNWIDQNLPIAAETLADILNNAKKHAEHVSIHLTSNATPENSQVVWGNDGETVELVETCGYIPITLSDWATTIVPMLVDKGTEFAQNARIEFEKAQKWAAENPTAIILIILGVAGLIVLVAYPGSIYKPVLDAFGFTSEGVAASAVHSMIGNVSPGSVFAFLQSAGAGGYGVVALDAALRAAGPTAMVAGAADFIRDWVEENFNGEAPVLAVRAFYSRLIPSDNDEDVKAENSAGAMLVVLLMLVGVLALGATMWHWSS